jgi:hypothetical protein
MPATVQYTTEPPIYMYVISQKHPQKSTAAPSDQDAHGYASQIKISEAGKIPGRNSYQYAKNDWKVEVPHIDFTSFHST